MKRERKNHNNNRKNCVAHIHNTIHQNRSGCQIGACDPAMVQVEMHLVVCGYEYLVVVMHSISLLCTCACVCFHLKMHLFAVVLN